jgi:hypothetical protein
MTCPTTFTLGGVGLPVSLSWQDQYAFSPVAQKSVRTIGGKVVVFSQSLSRGRPITLVSLRDQGWMDLPTVNAIQALSIVPGATYSLVIDATVFTVVFRHHEAPAFNARPLIARVIPDSDDWFLATVRLMTV